MLHRAPPYLQPARELPWTRGHELRYPAAYSATLLIGYSLLFISAAAIALLSLATGAIIWGAVLTLVGAAMGFAVRYAIRVARTRIELDAEGIHRRCGRVLTSVPWADVSRVDAVEKPGAVVVRSHDGASVTVDTRMVGAHVVEMYILRHVSDGSILFARGPEGRELVAGFPISRTGAESEAVTTAAEAKAFASTLDRLQRLVWCVPLLVVVNVAVYAWLALKGCGWTWVDENCLIQHGSNYTAGTLHGQLWRLWTSTYLHGGLLHLAVNLWALSAVGPLVERLFGSARFMLIYTLAGVGGSIASVLWHPFVQSVGASGALFGVFGALGAFIMSQRSALPPTVAKTTGANVGALIAINLLLGAVGQGVDNAAHIGGLVVGFCLGLLLAEAPISAHPPQRSPGRLLTAVAVSAAIGAAVFAGLESDALHPRGNPTADVAWQDPNPRALRRAAWGIAIGMTQAEVSARKGPPATASDSVWTYNAVDASRDGLVEIVFDSRARVAAIFYLGDGSGRPSEFPAVLDLDDLAPLTRAYGRPLIDKSVDGGGRYLRFRNGLTVARLGDELVVGIDHR